MFFGVKEPFTKDFLWIWVGAFILVAAPVTMLILMEEPDPPAPVEDGDIEAIIGESQDFIVKDPNWWRNFDLYCPQYLVALEDIHYAKVQDSSSTIKYAYSECLSQNKKSAGGSIAHGPRPPTAIPCGLIDTENIQARPNWPDWLKIEVYFNPQGTYSHKNNHPSFMIFDSCGGEAPSSSRSVQIWADMTRLPQS